MLKIDVLTLFPEMFDSLKTLDKIKENQSNVYDLSVNKEECVKEERNAANERSQNDQPNLTP